MPVSRLPFWAAPKVGAGEPLRKTDDSSALSFQKFHKLVWVVNHAPGLENVAESKPTVWGPPDAVAERQGRGDGSGGWPG